MTFTQSDARQAGKERKAGFNMSPSQARVAKQRNIIEACHKLGIAREHGEAAQLAVSYALLAGEWDTENIKKRIVEYLDGNGLCIKEIVATLIAADILKYYKTENGWIEGFREGFLEEYTSLEEMGIEDAQAHIKRPLGSVTEWSGTLHDELNIRFITHTDQRVLDKVPASVLHAANKLQNVVYVINPVVLPHLQKLREVTEGHALTQVEMQIHALEGMHSRSEEFQFLITADYRGRFYYRGGLITPQGPDFCKAILMYKEGVKLGKNGKKHLAIHYANVYGMDKVSIKDRVKWAKKEGCRLAIKVANGYFPKEADKPYQTLVAAVDWFNLMKWEFDGNKAKKYISHLVVHRDGTCNGLQHGAALMQDKRTAHNVNCTRATEEDKPQDAYGIAAEKAAEVADREQAPELAQIFMKHHRAAFKKAVMITTYGSQQQVETVFNTLEEKEQKLITAKYRREFKKSVFAGINEVAGTMRKMNTILQYALKNTFEDGPRAIFWKTSDGFPVMQSKRTQTEGWGLFEYRSMDIDPDGQVRSITANFIHSMDGDHLRATVHSADFPMTTVHDSYGCHAGNMEKLSSLIRENFAYVHAYDYVASLNKLSNLKIELPKIGDYDALEATEATYLFS